MSSVDRAEPPLGRKSSKSLIERAAAHLSSIEARPTTVAISPEAAGATAARLGAVPRREGGRRIEIDFDRLRRMGFALPGEQSPAAEEFRLIKRPLLGAALAQNQPPSGRNKNVIMVTSAQPNEGKTFVAMNLAFSIASEHDFHVLLIDADVPNPAMPYILGFEAETGLVEAISDPSIDYTELTIATNIENLTLLPSGRPQPGSSELLASTRMAQFVDQVAGRFPDRIVIFDTPPVLVRSDPIALAKHVGQVVFVVEAERTSRTALDEAIELIGSDRVSGVVLNKAPALVREQFGRIYGRYGR
jgi:protein-tyrosine kinase